MQFVPSSTMLHAFEPNPKFKKLNYNIDDWQLFFNNNPDNKSPIMKVNSMLSIFYHEFWYDCVKYFFFFA